MDNIFKPRPSQVDESQVKVEGDTLSKEAAAAASPNSIVDGSEAKGGTESIPSNASIPSEEGKEVFNEELMPNFSFPNELPDFLKSLLFFTANPEQRDALLLSILTMASSCLPGVYASYNGKKVNSNLFLLVTAAASCGKGIIEYSRMLLDPLTDCYQKEYEEELIQFQARMLDFKDQKQKGCLNKGDKPEVPQLHLHIIPANSSSAAFYDALRSNKGVGIIYETEADTMTNSLRSSEGPYSDVYRKAFHHEPILFYRKTLATPLIIKHPEISILLSGTPGQIPALIPSIENGLFSRFLYYKMDGDPLHWSNVFSIGSAMEEAFKSKSLELHSLTQTLRELPGVKIELPESLHDRFNEVFARFQEDYHCRYGEGIVASVRRMGLSIFRIMMIFTVLRHIDDLLGTNPESGRETILQITKEDCENALHMAGVLLEHTAGVYMILGQSELAIVRMENPKGLYEKLYESLPFEFITKDAVQKGDSLRVSRSSVERSLRAWTNQGKLIRLAQGRYQKPNTTKTEP